MVSAAIIPKYHYVRATRTYINLSFSPPAPHFPETMYHSSRADDLDEKAAPVGKLLSATTHHPSVPPLALSEYLAQQRSTEFPEPNTQNPYDGLAPISPQTTFTTANAQPMPLPTPDVTAADAAPPAPGGYDANKPEQPERPQKPQRSGPSSTVANDGEWQATRSQLLPSRNHGKRAEWIRGWSDEVSSLGEGTYCACSDTTNTIGENNEGPAGSDGKNGNTKSSGVRDMFSKGTLPTSDRNSLSVSDPELDVCRNCNRLPPPALGGTLSAPTGDKVDDSAALRPGRGLGRKMGDLFRRVKPGWKNSSQKKPAGDGNPPERAPAARVEPLRQASSGQQQSSTGLVVSPLGQNSNSLDFTHVPSPGQGVSPAQEATPYGNSGFGASSNSDNPRGDAGISKSMSRLQRAALLLQRSGRPSE
ncbi:hypothetical protein B0T26DRAFT_50862 [Lasiosphaeria miniovina]|uniref:Uncharacterized protein n=1 Tax=Lasiosphaeria miniovina TaxID=1954250 RepID=A0AA40EA59_9PEZI|nr:uncharacterized protein B0T26DRAFT_50862 [Lasiosphaeria miniovina]KAK0734059.1 hypothetical protein B0T26DRAFT_50862 [Lasiosphaeria miniovina]